MFKPPGLDKNFEMLPSPRIRLKNNEIYINEVNKSVSKLEEMKNQV